MKYYALDKEHHVHEVSPYQWVKIWKGDTRRVAATEIAKDISVSTVFLGIDHRYRDDGPPLLFETLIFGGALDGEMWRYSSWDDAEIGHQSAVRKAKQALKQNGEVNDDTQGRPA
jgi:hypothetical protein